MDPNTPAFASEDEEAAWSLSLLREGDQAQQVVARDRLAYIFERRGLLDAAIECLESNVRDGVRDPRLYQRLAGIYRRQGHSELADEALDEARDLDARLRRERPAVPRIDDLADDGESADHPLEAQTRPLPAARTPATFELGDELAATGTGITGTGITGTGVAGTGVAGTSAAGTAARVRPWYASPAVVTLAVLLGGPFGIALLWLQTGYTRRGKWTVTASWLALNAVAALVGWMMLQSNFEAILTARGAVAPPPSIGSTPATPSAGTLPIGSPGPIASPAGVTIGPPASPGPAASPSPSTSAPGTSAPGASSPGAPRSPSASGTERVRVGGSGTQGANLRERASASSPVVKVLAPGAVLDVVGPDQQAEGRGWRNVRDGTGATGWVAADLLEAVS